MMKQLKEMAKQSGSNSGDATEGDPCGLLDSSQVAQAIGPLAAPPYRGSFRPDARANSCRYDTQDHRRLLVSVDWSGGQMAMKMFGFGRAMTDQVSKQGVTQVGTTVLSSGDTLHGGWDQVAQGPMQCCDLHALRGDRHVEMDFTGTRLTMANAGVLLDAAVRRLDHPLAINGLAGMPAGQRLFAADAKDSTADMCELVSQATAEAALGTKLTGAPVPGTERGGAGKRMCSYTFTGPGGMRMTYDLTLREWHDGAVAFASDQYAVTGGFRALRHQITGDTTSHATSDTTSCTAQAPQGTTPVMTVCKRGPATAAPADTSPPGPWDEAGPAPGVGYEAVKGPYLVRIGAMGDQKTVLGFLAQAVTAVSAQH